MGHRGTIGPMGSTAVSVSADEPSQAHAEGFFFTEPRLSGHGARIPGVGIYPLDHAALSARPYGC